MLFQTKSSLSEHWKQCPKTSLQRHNIEYQIMGKQPAKATARFQLTAPMKSSSSTQISKQQTEMLPIQNDSVQGSADIAVIETMEISDITKSHENQRNSSSNLEILVQSRKKLSEDIGQAEAEATLFSSEKYQTIDLSSSSSPASQRSRSPSRSRSRSVSGSGSSLSSPRFVSATDSDSGSSSSSPRFVSATDSDSDKPGSGNDSLRRKRSKKLRQFITCKMHSNFNLKFW